MTIADALREAIAEEMRRDEKIFLIGEDIGVPGGFGGAFGVYLGLPEEFGHDRIIDTPISEKAVMGAAIGAAIAGLVPLADLQYSDFVYCCMDEIANQAAKIPYMSNSTIGLPMVIRFPVGASQRGAQHAQSPVTALMHIPGLKIVCVSDAYDAKGLLKTALRDPDPVMVFEHKLLYGSKGRMAAGGFDLTAEVPEDDYTIPLGQARVRREGTDVTIIATFIVLYRALQVAEKLTAEGISCEVIDPRSLVPMDTETILNSVAKTGRLVVAHEDNLTAGWGAEVAAIAASECFYNLEAPIQRVATYDVPLPFYPAMENALVPSAERIEQGVRAALDA